MKYLIPSIIIFISSCVPISPTDTSQQQQLIYDNQDYDFIVGMVQLYPISQDHRAELDYPVISLNEPGLRLTFDLLEENSAYVNARYVHCNADWQESNLADLQFLDVYNEFPINQNTYSQNTITPYVSYDVNLPTPTKSGNYLLVVYKNNDRNNILFSRRFLVFESGAKIETELRASTSVAKLRANQQIEFSVKYQSASNPNPLRDFKVVILQNHNWNTAIKGLEPTQIRPDRNTLVYRHFSGENNFPGLNEFRFFDLRSIDFRGMNVARVNKATRPVSAYLGIDKSRGGQAYSQLIDDLNGGYFLENRDPDDTQFQSEYVKTNFELMHEPIDGEIYLVGRWNNWELLPENEMTYNQSTGSYQGSAFLKQGYYDYFYWVESETEPYYLLEGSHFQTRNTYELLFYYRNPFNNYDQLIGYGRVSSGN